MAGKDLPPWVLRDTDNTRTREAMLLGASFEGGWTSPYPVGDQGTSFGPFQMHDGRGGLTPAQAENPKFAVPSMLPSYEAAANQISDREWDTDPEKAAEQTAFIAESPAQDYYATYGNSGVNQRWTATRAELSGKKGKSGAPPQRAQLTSFPGSSAYDLFRTALGLATGNPAASWNGLKAFFGSDIAEWLIRGALIMFGAILILMGLHGMTSGSNSQNITVRTSDNDGTQTTTVSGNAGPVKASHGHIRKAAEGALTDAALGGPEDPIADVAAAGVMAT